MPQSLRNGAPRAVVHSVQVEESLHSIRRLETRKLSTFISVNNSARDLAEQPPDAPLFLGLSRRLGQWCFYCAVTSNYIIAVFFSKENRKS